MNAQSPENAGVSAERKAFLDAAFKAHLSAAINQDISAILDTYAEGGYLNFNGVIYDTPEKLAAFHLGFGLTNKGMLADLERVILTKSFTHDSVIIEYRVKCTVEIPEGSTARRTEMRSLTIYQFDANGKLMSERAFNDTGAILPEPIVPRFHTGWSKDDYRLR